MQYMILIYGNAASWEALDADASAAIVAAHEVLQEELEASGEFVDASELPPENAKIVRMKGSMAEVTDGPFVELKEIVAGYYVVTCSSLERATEIAARLAAAEFGLVELRQMVREPGHGDNA
ncbi:MAG: YciI family protein [Humibacillus sp.]|nr:YciI family protein [Humibacillus sp.]MDN5778576.1 YciI family protein [Humibacillus sp.]